MEIRGPDQDEFRSSYGFVERRRDQGSSNGVGVGHMQNGSKTPPAVAANTGPALPNYTQPVDSNHRPTGSLAKRPYEKYRECLRNHAASLGGNVYDGCGEFMPAGEEGTLEALKCAACDCHRNFHRKETDGEQPSTPQLRRRSGNATPNVSNNVNAPPMLHGLHLPALSYHPHPHPYHQRYAPVVQPMSVAYESSSEEMNMYHNHSNNSMDHQGGVAPPPPPYVLSKKRFRTKFTVEQKERMMEFADKIGWRINRQEEGEVERFCEAAGIRRQVFKVWMHNNKNARKTDAPPDLDDKSNHVI